MQNHKSKIVFKDYSPNQILLLPPSLEEMIRPSHPVRVVNQVIDNLDIDPLIKKYNGGGCSSYHPRLMLKILVYGYLFNQYSSRKIEQAVTQNMHFMWLSGMSYPDHNTINRFRSERLKGVLKEVFSQFVLLLVEKGVITLKEACPDGTKIEANANRYTKEKVRVTDNGFKKTNRVYQAQNCNRCPMKNACNKSRGNRKIEINNNLNRYKSIIKERLNSERGKRYRSQRPVDVEAVFGIIKGNRNYRKFLLRGLEKVEIEVGLLALAHNLSKIAARN